jgi:hypothetical protein
LYKSYKKYGETNKEHAPIKLGKPEKNFFNQRNKNTPLTITDPPRITSIISG